MIGGISIGAPQSRYWSNGFYGTAAEHAARKQKTQQQERVQAPYEAGAPSAGSANTAANQTQNSNPGLDFTVDPYGRTNLSNRSLMEREAEERRRAAESEAEAAKLARREADRRELLALINKQSNPRSAATITHPGAGGNEAARSAAFSRAKDNAGKIARASLTAIAEEMAGRGISGSGIEALREAGAVGGAGSSLIDVERDQAIADAERAGDVNDQIYQGGITQRGQDLSQRQSMLALLRSIYDY